MIMDQPLVAPTASGLPFQRLARCVLSGLMIALVGGCGKPALVPVEGRVTLDDKPLGGAAITFMPLTAGLQPATAGSDADGRFRLETRQAPGTMPGLYKVVVSKYEPAGNAEKAPGASSNEMPLVTHGGRPNLKSLLPTRYGDFSKTPLQVEVPKEGTNSVHLELTRP